MTRETVPRPSGGVPVDRAKETARTVPQGPEFCAHSSSEDFRFARRHTPSMPKSIVAGNKTKFVHV